jgi:hypothetical protein
LCGGVFGIAATIDPAFQAAIVSRGPHDAGTQLIDRDVLIDTDNDSMCDRHNDQSVNYCVFAAEVFQIVTNADIAAQGSKPLILLATSLSERFILEGRIDVASHRTSPEMQGAGTASRSSCPGSVAAIGGSGGFGGSFGSSGGDGADGKPNTGASGRAAIALSAPPVSLRGGCPGGDGGNGTTGTGGTGGAGGGAVAIIAHAITFAGQINASGEPGQGGVNGDEDGGGGGGAGGGGGGGAGFIYAPGITNNAQVSPPVSATP